MKYVIYFLLILSLPLFSFDGYSTVAGGPKLAVEAGQFSFYWALWREWKSPEEVLISKRTLTWEVKECVHGKRIFGNGETFWYLDQGPIREAYRENYLYLTLVNFNSLLAKGQGAFIAPARLANESFQEYTKRKSNSYQAWKNMASVRNYTGTITIEANHRVYPKTSSSGFILVSEYAFSTQPLYLLYFPFHPSQWPFFWDERAHKAHTIQVPPGWNKKYLAETSFLGRLEWNWCENDLKAELVIPKGGMPPEGPNRAGRMNTVSYPFQVREE